MIGVILAGGTGTRLYPSTLAVNKHLIPVYDKPLIYYSLSTLLLAKIFNIIIVSDSNGVSSLKRILGNGSNLGIKIRYSLQKTPSGILDGLNCAIKEYKIEENICLILGDNIFYAEGLGKFLLDIKNKINKEKKNTILAYQTTEKEAQNYGVIKFNKKNVPVKIIEKPKKFISRYIVPGIYFLNKNSYKFIKKIKISKRKEYEISNFNELLLKKKMLNISRLGRGVAWFDAGSNTKLLQASLFIKTIQDRLGFKICCPEEIIFNFKKLNYHNIKNIIRNSKGDYRKYLLKCLKKK